MKSIDDANADLVSRFEEVLPGYVFDEEVKVFIARSDGAFRKRCAGVQDDLRAQNGGANFSLDFDWATNLKIAQIRLLGPNHFVLRFNWRFLASIYMLVHRMWANPAFEAWIFKKEAAGNLDVRLPDLPRDWLTQGIGLVKSPDPVRRLVADFFAQSVANFIFTHELAHVSLGHWELVERLREEISKLEEKGLDTSDTYLSLQALEADADRQAALNGLAHMAGMRALMQHGAAEDEEIKAAFEFAFESNSRLYAWGGMVAVVALMFPQIEPREIVAASHPPQLIRLQMLLMELMFHQYKYVPDENEKQRLQILATQRAVLCGAALLAGLTGRPFELGTFGVPMEIFAERVGAINKRVSELVRDYKIQLRHFELQNP